MVLTPLLGEAGDGLVASLAQNGDGLRADQAGAADDDDLHEVTSCSGNQCTLCRNADTSLLE